MASMHRIWVVAGLSVAGTLLAAAAPGQPTYSIDGQGPTLGLPAGPGGFIGPIAEGDILTPVGPGVPPPAPAIAIPVGPTGLGLVIPGVIPAEVDALSYGVDPLLQQNQAFPLSWTFSVDEFASGLPAVPFPSVTTEGALGLLEASADIYGSATPPGPIPPGPFGGNAGVFDGNGGLTPFVAPGLNLIEPNPPSFAAVPDPGDNVDAWDIDTPPSFPVYYSLDASYPDPLEPPGPPNTGSALARGFVGADVLVSAAPGGPPALYAAAPLLGLNLISPVLDSDDLDALVLWENGAPGYQPTLGPYSWLGAGGTDMLLYSVRRGSAVIGLPDALFGAPIEEGDILIPVFTGGGYFPGIWVPAELLGLTTVRSATAPVFPDGLAHGDDLDALDVRVVPEPGALVLLAVGVTLMVARRRGMC